MELAIHKIKFGNDDDNFRIKSFLFDLSDFNEINKFVDAVCFSFQGNDASPIDEETDWGNYG